MKLYIQEEKYARLIKEVLKVFPNYRTADLVVKNILEILDVKVLTEKRGGFIH